ncbi:hypothetical protein FBUS_00859 [Fasciolopsis buskii]|uniref:C3H1-type domain-containing protein n=1 Tax=Fasciolopsis buskii TaxID=27845 RepID=A0A8E0RXV1_9TREM|nr:hypothetical protein FBUS_00859 [Fasciolopsis buski]
MNRVHVCYYYQAGCCRNGDACQFAHPTVKCRSFSSTGWCPYGYNCHFWHDHSTKPSAPNLARKPCPFFVINQCKYGDRCTFSHDLKNEHDNYRTLAEFRASKSFSQLSLSVGTLSLDRNSFSDPKATDPSRRQKAEVALTGSPVPFKNDNLRTTTSDSLNRIYRPAFIRPKTSNSGTPLEGATKAEVYRLQQLEVERFLKSYPKDKLCEVQSFDSGRVFHLKFSSSDPDWVSLPE